MRHEVRGLLGCGVAALVLVSSAARADVLTADRAAQLALERNSGVIQSVAGVLDARAGLYGAYSGVLPSVSADITRSGSRSEGNEGTQLFGTVLFPSNRTDNERYSTSPSISGSWNVLDLSALRSMQSARLNMKGSRFSLSDIRQQVAFNTRSQFYDVVKSIRLAEVASSSLRLSRDDERRVRALFEVGSVSRSDLLKAQVRSAQSLLDSLNAAQAVSVQRTALAATLGLKEIEMGDVDTSLTFVVVDVDEAAIQRQAATERADVKAADVEVRASRASLSAANFARLPAVSARGSMAFDTKSSFSQKVYGLIETSPGSGVFIQDPVSSGRNSSDRGWSASLSLSMPIFSGMAVESRIAGAQARHARAQDRRDVLMRGLDADVHVAVLQYRQSIAQDAVARQAVESAQENLKLTQQKYNVGSSTILDLIDAQVQLQRAQSDAVSALAGIRVSEARLNRMRGRE